MAEYKARPLSRVQIRKFTHRIRETLGIKDKVYVDVVKLLEQILPEIYGDDFNYEYVDDDEIDALALTTPDEGKILIRNSVYLGAINGRGRDRFTIMHEIAHFFLHKGMTVKLARGSEEIKTFEKPEWQADAFAGEFLMDSDIVKNMSPEDISRNCVVSLAAATCQYKQYQKIKKTG